MADDPLTGHQRQKSLVSETVISPQTDLTKPRKLLDNRITYPFITMALGKIGSGMAALGMLAMASGAEAKNQKAELLLPHPDGAIAVDVSRVAVETQAAILEQLQSCLQEGFTFADADENGKIEGDESYDLWFERDHCANIARLNLEQADAESRIAEAKAGQAEADRRIADADTRLKAAQKAMAAITDKLIADAQAESR